MRKPLGLRFRILQVYIHSFFVRKYFIRISRLKFANLFKNILRIHPRLRPLRRILNLFMLKTCGTRLNCVKLSLSLNGRTDLDLPDSKTPCKTEMS